MSAVKPAGSRKPGSAPTNRTRLPLDGTGSSPVSKGWKSVLRLSSGIGTTGYQHVALTKTGAALRRARRLPLIDRGSGAGFGFLALLLAGDLLARLLVDDLHRQAHLATLVEAHELDEDLVAFLDHVGRLLDTVGRELRDMDEAVLGAEEIDESAEVGRLDDRAFIDLADFRLSHDGMD